MEETVGKLMRTGTGILAADESTGTIGKRFTSVGLENTHENRFNYRNMLFNTPDLEKFISGVILFEETLFDTDSNGVRLVQPLLDKDIVLGIKTDLGLVDINSDEQRTRGLDDLEERSKKYYEAGARFAKFRCVYKIGQNLPSDLVVKNNALTLALYASVSQKCGLVPIVEPEVLMDGSHGIEDCQRVTKKVLSEVFYALNATDVQLEHILLKPNFVVNGTENKEESGSKIARSTLSVMLSTVPPMVPGIVFLSGGMSEHMSSYVLGAVNKLAPKYTPWKLTFSFGRALQKSALEEWSNLVKNNNLNDLSSAQNLLLQKCRMNSCSTLFESS